MAFIVMPPAASILSARRDQALLPLLVQLPALASAAQREALLEAISRFVASAAYGTDLMQEQHTPLRPLNAPRHPHSRATTPLLTRHDTPMSA